MKRVFLAVAALLVAASAARAQTVTAALIHHNIHSGGQAQDAANHIVDLLNMTPQKGLVLCNEANNARQYFTLPYNGWHHIWRATPHEGRGNPIFTRDAAVTLLSSWVLEMQQPWTYSGNDKEPRVYTVVKCELAANPWVQFHCVNVHFPTNSTANEPARQESVDRLIELSQSMPVLPLIICGDFNMGESAARQRIANPIGGRLYTDANVDHIIVRDGQNVGFTDNVSVVRLGQFISDHQALRYNFTFTQLNPQSAVSDWELY